MKQTSDIILSIVGILIIVAILIFGYRTRSPEIVVADLVSENATTTYTHMELSYPKSSEKEYPEIFTLVNETKKQFLDDYGSLTESEAQAQYIRRDVAFELYINTKIATSTNTVTYILETYEYTGGAHGGTDVNTFTYNNQGKLIKLSEVLGDNYLQKVSSMSREYFYKNLGDYTQKSMIDDGTEPKLENFNAWYLTHDSVVFMFGQYQIGPYVLGLQEFVVNKNDIIDILNPAYK